MLFPFHTDSLGIVSQHAQCSHLYTKMIKLLWQKIQKCLMKDICRSYDCPEFFYCDKITTDSWCWKFTDWSWGWDKGVQPYGWFTSAFVIYTVPESLDPDTAHIWWAGKELMRNKCLQDHIGKNEKTKVYLPKCHLVTNYTYLFPIVQSIYVVEKMLALALRALHLWPESCHSMTKHSMNSIQTEDIGGLAGYC